MDITYAIVEFESKNFKYTSYLNMYKYTIRIMMNNSDICSQIVFVNFWTY
jgi:hypothetical protein